MEAPGALHHIIARGIAHRKVFDDNADRYFFVDRLGLIFRDTSTQCFAWELIPNHSPAAENRGYADCHASELGVSQAWLSKRLKLSQPAISLSVARGRAIDIKNNCGIGNL
jgi:hypothetical protein